MKSFQNISWLVDEPTYRADSALSYSTLATYERGGFNALPTLFDKKTSPSLLFGSIVDCLITGSKKEFEDNYVIIQDPNISDTLKDITKTLINLVGAMYPQFKDIPDNVLAQTGKECGFYEPDKYEAVRIKKIKEGCNYYYQILQLCKDKTAITQKDYDDAMKCVDALHQGFTGTLLGQNNPFDTDIEYFYQLKFKGEDPVTKVQYRSMADCIKVDYKNKIVYPIDLKTSYHKEWEFPLSFIQWSYAQQARLYWRMIRQNMDKDPDFKDFKLADYTFVVVNRETCIPLAWTFRDTQVVGKLEYSTLEGKKIIIRDPYTIGKELNDYLLCTPSVPKDINLNGTNDIINYITTH